MRLIRSRSDVWTVCAFIALVQIGGSAFDWGNLIRFDRNWRKAKQRGV